MVKISVCIPTFNYGRYIGAAVESVLSQTEQDFEIIICDNDSDDDTEQIVRKFVAVDNRIRYQRNTTNIGMIENWNRCLTLASGRYIKFLCADDLLDSVCLQHLAQLLDEHESVVLVACARKLIDENSNSRPKVLAFSKKEEILDGICVIRRCVARANLIGEPTAVMFRRSALQDGFNNSYPQVVDLEMWLRLLEKGMFAFTPQALCSLRQHSDQETHKNLLSKEAFVDEFKLYHAYINKAHIKIGLIDKVSGYLRRLAALQLYQLNKR